MTEGDFLVYANRILAQCGPTNGRRPWQVMVTDMTPGSVLGQCDCVDRVIILSRTFVANATEEEIRPTLIHEIAHAWTCREKRPHGPLWKAKMREFGLKQSARRQPFRLVWWRQPRYYGICEECRTYRFAFGKRRVRIACGDCCRDHSRGEFDERFAITWKPLTPEKWAAILQEIDNG